MDHPLLILSCNLSYTSIPLQVHYSITAFPYGEPWNYEEVQRVSHGICPIVASPVAMEPRKSSTRSTRSKAIGGRNRITKECLFERTSVVHRNRRGYTLNVINILLMPAVTQAFHLLIATGCVWRTGTLVFVDDFMDYFKSAPPAR